MLPNTQYIHTFNYFQRKYFCYPQLTKAFFLPKLFELPILHLQAHDGQSFPTSRCTTNIMVQPKVDCFGLKGKLHLISTHSCISLYPKNKPWFLGLRYHSSPHENCLHTPKWQTFAYQIVP